MREAGCACSVSTAHPYALPCTLSSSGETRAAFVVLIPMYCHCVVAAVQLLPEESGGSASSALAPVEAPAEEVDVGEGEGAAAATGIDGGEAEVLAAVTSVAAGAGGDGGGGEECEGGSDKGPSALDPHELSVLPRCCVVALLQRQPRDIVACLSTADEAALRSANPEGPTAASTSAAATVCCVPLDRRLPLVRVRVRGAARLLGQRMVLRVDGWERRSMWPSGHVVRLLGSAGELGPESEAVLVQCGVRWQPFCSGAIGELPQVRGACRCVGARACRIWCLVELQFGVALLISTT